MAVLAVVASLLYGLGVARVTLVVLHLYVVSRLSFLELEPSCVLRSDLVLCLRVPGIVFAAHT
jgi:hypothetical protein